MLIPHRSPSALVAFLLSVALLPAARQYAAVDPDLSELVAVPDVLMAGDQILSTIRALPKDAAGRPLGPGQTVEILPSRGAPFGLMAVVDDWYEQELLLGPEAGLVEVRATVNGVLLSPVATIQVRPAELDPEVSSLTAERNSLTADGTATTLLSVTPQDRFGNLLGSGLAVSLQASAGALLDAIEDLGNGTYTQLLQSSADPVRALVQAAVDSVPLLRVITVDFVLSGAITQQALLPPDVDASLACDIGDLDGDGDPDVVVANYGENRLILGDGDGDAFLRAGAPTKRAQTILPGGSALSEDIDLLDANRDGKPDLFVSNYEGQNHLLMNEDDRFVDRTGEFLPAIDNLSRAAVIADFDGRRGLDIFVANDGFTQNQLLLRKRKGGYADRTNRLPSIEDNSVSAAAGDVDRDGDIDIVVANFFDQNRLLLNDSTGRFHDATLEEGRKGTRLPARLDRSLDVDLLDVDGDRDLDLLISNDGQNTLLINDGAGFFEDQTLTRMPLADGWTSQADTGDVDRDGDQDIVYVDADPGPQFVHILLNDGDGVLVDEAANVRGQLGVEPGPHPFVRLGDLDDDGDLDLFLPRNGQDVLLLLTTLTVTNVYPKHGIADGRAEKDVILTGSGIDRNVVVEFGGELATLTDYDRGRRAAVKVPGVRVPQTVDVRITNPNGRAVFIPGGFTYTPVTISRPRRVGGGIDAEDYAMVSVPLITRPLDLFQFRELLGLSADGVRWRLFRSDGTDYVEFTDDMAAGQSGAIPEAILLRPGRSYWFAARDAATLEFWGGNSDMGGAVEVILHIGWNQVANPYAKKLPVRKIKVTDGIKTVKVGRRRDSLTNGEFLEFLGFNASGEEIYGAAGSLKPFGGAWLENVTNGELRLIFERKAVRSARESKRTLVLSPRSSRQKRSRIRRSSRRSRPPGLPPFLRAK